MKDNQKRIITTQKIDDYCLWLDRCERSRETIQKYEYYLTRFMEFMAVSYTHLDVYKRQPLT